MFKQQLKVKNGEKKKSLLSSYKTTLKQQLISEKQKLRWEVK